MRWNSSTELLYMYKPHYIQTYIHTYINNIYIFLLEAHSITEESGTTGSCRKPQKAERIKFGSPIGSIADQLFAKRSTARSHLGHPPFAKLTTKHPANWNWKNLTKKQSCPTICCKFLPLIKKRVSRKYYWVRSLQKQEIEKVPSTSNKIKTKLLNCRKR